MARHHTRNSTRATRWVLSALLGLSLQEPVASTRRLPISHQLHRRSHPDLTPRSTAASLQFNSKQSAHFYVDGKNITFVDFDAGPSYAGLIPVSDTPGETRKLFFWFWPAESNKGADDLTFWTNGGPGCSSLESLLQETGPISWRLGQARPVKNPFSWTKLSSMLYVEHPVGTGYSEGVIQAHNETDVARDLFGFFQQWLKVFPEMNNKNFYLTGESYAGLYVPYLADYIYSHQANLSLPLQGIFIIDPVLTYNVVSNEIPAWPMVQRYEYVFGLNRTFKAEIEKLHTSCGYADYISKYDTYPPPAGPFPIPKAGTYDSPPFKSDCALWEKIWNATLIVNPAFDIYHIFDTVPILWDVLSATTESSQLWPGQTGDPTYFNRTEVKELLHVPISSNWSECSYKDVFVDAVDSSDHVSMSILPGVIEKSKRTIIAHGLADFVLIAQGSRMAIQNMTWNGVQGFTKPIDDDFLVEGQGTMGRYRSERGLVYAEIELSGHMLPQYQPNAGYQMLQYLLGQADSPSASSV